MRRNWPTEKEKEEEKEEENKIVIYFLSNKYDPMES